MQPRARLLALAFLTLLVVPAAASAQQRPASPSIGSDRPGLGDAAHVLGEGVWQLEAGLTAFGGGLIEASGTALLRWGIAPLELRFTLPSPVVLDEDGGTEFGDIGVGLKTSLAQTGNWQWSVIGGVTLPTGSPLAGGDETRGLANFIGETTLTDDVALALNFGYLAAFDDFGDGVVSVIATPSIALGDGLSAYAGYAGFLAEGPDAHFLEAGLALATRADLQLDVNTGYDVDGDTWFLGLGVAIRRR